MSRMKWMFALGGVVASAALWACATMGQGGAEGGGQQGGGDPLTQAGTCAGPYPSYWQDPKFTSTGMWQGQQISNQPPADWKGPIFRLSQKYPEALPPEENVPWKAFNPFKAGLSQEDKRKQAYEYSWAVLRYIQEGNVDQGASGGDIEKDWTLCNNPVRSWVHIPFQTYEPLGGREFIHGLTREAPVTFTMKNGTQLKSTVWAVGFYNPRAAYTLGQTWRPDGKAVFPTSNVAFPEGAVIGKLLFTTATDKDIPILSNMPVWKANISDPAFCGCSLPKGQACSFQQLSQMCPRSEGQVTLMQLDIAVRDARSPSGWAYGTFVADGQVKAGEKNPWNRLSTLGLMWGNDVPPAGQLAIAYPADPRKNGFAQEVVEWEVADRWNATTDGGHLGCNSRLDGPADSTRSSCLSCHMTGSVPDKNRKVPAFIVTPTDSSGKPIATEGQCAQAPGQPDLDATYFAELPCSTPFSGTGVAKPQYPNGSTQWVSTDFSLQLSISMVQWMEWQADQVEEANGPRIMQGVLPGR
ncbi:hypothetical protein [Hyalangium gracile]|uniref:hypothetical protein n=1 Tax=Hyalangium gracile TaxID=394092 RepID=UPI001CCB885F|nr:hypothetical protein [Hyalangium gracile]